LKDLAAIDAGFRLPVAPLNAARRAALGTCRKGRSMLTIVLQTGDLTGAPPRAVSAGVTPPGFKTVGRGGGIRFAPAPRPQAKM